MEKKEKIEIFKVDKSAHLLGFLLENNNGKSRTKIKGLLAHGLVFVNDRPVTQFDHPLKPGDEVKFGSQPVHPVAHLPHLRIIFEDEMIILIHKNSGLLSVATEKEKSETAYSILSRYVKSQNPRNKIFIVHRLDKDASGLMLFAKSPEVQETLQKNWQEMVVERTYTVVVEGVVDEDSGTIDNFLVENKNLVMFSTSKPGEGQRAISHYRVIRRNRDWSMVEVSLETGRKNQIRVHMKELGHPIAGDKKYGARENPLRRLALHARVLHFIHPVSRREMKFETPVPHEFTKLFNSSTTHKTIRNGNNT